MPVGLVSGLTTGKRVGMDFLKRKKGLKWGPRGNGFLSDMRGGVWLCVCVGGRGREGEEELSKSYFWEFLILGTRVM